MSQQPKQSEDGKTLLDTNEILLKLLPHFCHFSHIFLCCKFLTNHLTRSSDGTFFVAAFICAFLLFGIFSKLVVNIFYPKASCNSKTETKLFWRLFYKRIPSKSPFSYSWYFCVEINFTFIGKINYVICSNLAVNVICMLQFYPPTLKILHLSFE